MLTNIRKSYSQRKWWHKVFLRSTSSLKVLGIETSFDETGCAVLDGNGNILSNAIHSHLRTHLELGGVIPTMAREIHNKYIKDIFDEAVQKSNLTVKDLDAIAVTVKPGQLSSIIVGVEYAKGMCLSFQKPLIPIHHMEAHALTIRMIKDVKFPFLTFLISGAHCLLALVKEVDDFLLLGESRDDGPGHMLDMVARKLKLRNMRKYEGLSGGAAIEKAAKEGDPNAFRLRFRNDENRDCNFCFSGLRTCVAVKISKLEKKHGIEGDQIVPKYQDICAGLQYALALHLGLRMQRAAAYIEKWNLIGNEKYLVVSGGVACNQYIIKILERVCNELGYKVLVPPPNLCTDNGMMVAWNGIEKLKRNIDLISPNNLESVNVAARYPLGKDYTEEVRKEKIKVRLIKVDPNVG